METAVFFLLVFVLGCCQSKPVFRFANVFGDHMVLQQAPHRAQLWGYGEVGQKVKVTLNGKEYRAVVGPKGKGSKKKGLKNYGMWSVLLVPTKFGGPYVIDACSTVNGALVKVSLKDVLFGDVWICSGQSNMQYTVDLSDNGASAIRDAANYPNIRLFTAENGTSEVPLSELTQVRQPWSVASPEAVRGRTFYYFSAVCWYYGVELYDRLQYPIGLVSTTWVGTSIEAWSSPDALAKCTPPNFEHKPRGPQHNFSYLWNGLISPFLRMTIYGAIWYQGEENAERPVLPYYCTFPAFIDDWRAKSFLFTRRNTKREFPFGFAQLSATGESIGGQAFNFAPFRWDQTAQFGYVPNARQRRVFMAVTMDLGNPQSIFGALHPSGKKDVSQRLARASWPIAYGVSAYYSGPLVSEINKQQDATIKVIYRSVFGEIEVRSTAGFELLCQETNAWIEATITDSGPRSVSIMPSTPCFVKAVRYAWSDYPCINKKCAIYSDDLPSPPFIKYGPFNW